MFKKSLVLAVAIVVIVLSMLVGYKVGCKSGYESGKNDTIRQAELVEVTDSEYYIDFGGDVHAYTFE